MDEMPITDRQLEFARNLFQTIRPQLLTKEHAEQFLAVSTNVDHSKFTKNQANVLISWLLYLRSVMKNRYFINGLGVESLPNSG